MHVEHKVNLHYDDGKPFTLREKEDKGSLQEKEEINNYCKPRSYSFEFSIL